MRITLLDPSLKDNSGNPSINLGDLIIYESVSRYLDEIFPGYDLLRISSHIIPTKELLHNAKQSEFVFFGGTNALSSDIQKYHQWKIEIPSKIFWPFNFPIKNIILFGVGWWQYQNAATSFTTQFYKKALSSSGIHSVRDSYTLEKLKGMGFKNIVNTGCPTTWPLHGMDVSTRKGSPSNCLFTLTDYHPNREKDNEIIKLIASGYSGQLYFFPQGTLDVDYINKLDSFAELKPRIIILNRTFDDFVNCLKMNDIDYIGTRLHAGIKALQMKKNALIFSVDNRAAEISKDIGLPVISRLETEKLIQWINGDRLFGAITIPLKEIEQWKRQFISGN